MNPPAAELKVDLLGVIIAVTDEVPRVLVVDGEDGTALPHGPFMPGEHTTLEAGFRTLIEQQAGLDLYYIEQLYTFGNQYRTAEEIGGGPRTLSVAYVALTREVDVPAPGTRWADWYDFLPWEDWRGGRPDYIADLAPALTRWRNASRSATVRRNRAERVNVTFGDAGTSELDGVLTLERLELLYDAGLLGEAERDRRAIEGETPVDLSDELGLPMASDHRRVLATALGRIRGKLAYRPVVFELLPGEFTLYQLQRVAEALSGSHLHKQNFRRLVMNANLVEAVGRTTAVSRGRPAKLYRFRREVLGEKLTVGLARPMLKEE